MGSGAVRLQQADRESRVCVGSGDTANEIGLIIVQADHLADPAEREQRRPPVHAAFAVGGVPPGDPEPVP